MRDPELGHWHLEERLSACEPSEGLEQPGQDSGEGWAAVELLSQPQESEEGVSETGLLCLDFSRAQGLRTKHQCFVSFR